MGNRLLHIQANLALLSFPVLLPQAAWLRRTVPRLPEAAGPRSVTLPFDGDQAKPLRLLIFGESTAAGTGAPTQMEALARRTAHALQQCLARSVHYHVIGRNGATAIEATHELIPQLRGTQPFDLVAIALGVNDAMRLRSPAQWRNDLTEMLVNLTAHVGNVPIFFSGMPPVENFPALFSPLNRVLGLRARLLNGVSAEVIAAFPHIQKIQVEVPPDPAFFATDAFHPGPKGYAEWGVAVATAYCKNVRPCLPSTNLKTRATQLD